MEVVSEYILSCGGIYYMSFFTKKDEFGKPKESNEISNKELKEHIANHAILQLREGIDYDGLAHTKVEFGYLFDIEGHGIEALFKIITDKTTLYFAVQGTKMIWLDYSEELFNSTVVGFLDLHG